MAKQKLGQHFLYDKKIAEKIISTIHSSEEAIIEIGPGKGIMTELLAGQGGERPIIAIEKDKELYNNLLSSENLKGVEILNKDILKFNIGEVSESKNITILGNIPYYISKEIIDWIISENEFISSGTLLVQKEFFLKVTSSPGIKTYNAQSVIFGLIFNSKKVFDVKPGSFSPPPKVTSVVFTFTKPVLRSPGGAERGQTPFGGEIAGLYKMLKTAFLHRRKTLINNLGKDYNKEKISKFLESKSLPPDIRAEDISREDLMDLYLSL